MIHRHPHVFGDVAVDGPAGVVVNWEKLKNAEKRERLSLLDGVPAAMPRSRTRRACRNVRLASGSTRHRPFPWRSTLSEGARSRRARRRRSRRGRARRGLGVEAGDPEVAIGDLLFAVVALARRLRVNPEEALRGRAMGFAPGSARSRLSAREDGVDLHDLDDAAWRARWEATASGEWAPVPCQKASWAASYAGTRRHIASFVSLGAGKRIAPSVPPHVQAPTARSPCAGLQLS